MPLHNDEPTLVDQLERAALVKEVSEAVATCMPPQVFGIHGDWGLGKTSFLHQMQLCLTGECPQQPEHMVAAGKRRKPFPIGAHKDRVTVVWFEAWRYQHDDAPVVALLHEIRAQLAWYVKLRGKLLKETAVMVRAALLSLEDVTKQIGFQLSKFDAARERWDRDHLASALPSHTVREHLTDAIGKLLSAGWKGESRRLVVLIDDLDRCESEAAYRLLEGLKIYLTLPNCVFVLGMNQKVIEEAIGKSLPRANRAQTARRAAAYLEKLCQNVWRLRSVPDPNRRLCAWLSDSSLSATVAAALNGLDCLPPNPRRIKGLANLLQRFGPRLPNRGNSAERIRQCRMMLVVAYVYQFHHELFVRWEANPGLYEHIRDWVRGARKDDAVFKGLDLVWRVEADESTATPERFRSESVFPDPGESNLFWIQPLILKLGDDVFPAEFVPYLRGTG